MRKRAVYSWMTGALLAFTFSTCWSESAGTSSGQVVPVAESKASNWWSGDIWKEEERGFNWYPPDEVVKAKPSRSAPKKEEPESIAQPKRKALKDMKTFDEVEKEVNRLRELAVFEPSSENVLTYLRAQEYVLSKSSTFADTARRVVWQNPDVDYNNKNPVANYSQMSKKERMNEKRNDVVADIAKTHGLVFFFKSDCPYCHDMAPVLRALENQYGVQVMAVSMDGGVVPGFPNPRRDNGISKFVSNGEGITTVPALYLVANQTKTVTSLGTGALAMDEITERIRVLLTTKPGQEF